MERFFLPYAHNSPAAIEIKGHRLLIVSKDAEEIVEDLQALGGDEVREVEVPGGDPEAATFLAALASTSNCGVVLAPPGISPSAMINNLEKQLPWVQ